MRLEHVGVRPTYPLALIDFKKKIYCEEYPDGTFKLWNQRMLKSGCGNIIEAPMEMMDCYYCPKCDEWFSKKQWVGLSEE